MRYVFLAFLAALALAGCRSFLPDPGPAVPEVEIRVARVRPDQPLIQLEHHSNQSYIDAVFVIAGPEEYRGRTLRLKLMPESPGKLFEHREFRLKLPQNVVEGRNRERTNSDGKTTVWADTDARWNFESIMIEALDTASPAPPAR